MAKKYKRPSMRAVREERLARRRAKRATSQEETPDPRSTFANVEAIGGVPVEDPTHIVVVEPVRLDDGNQLLFQSPHVPPFYLLTAKQFRDQAEPKRLKAITRTVTTPDGTLRPHDPRGAFDGLEGLAIAVILAAAAIEAHANDVIRRLPEEASVEVERKGMSVVYERDSMERGLRLAEKLTLAAPLLTGRRSIKGTKAWEAYRRVIPLRNELLHVKPRAQNDPDEPGPFGLLMLGKGSRAPEDAAAVIHAVEPDWIPEHVRPDLGIS